jgi:hypothetical protein
MKSAAIVSIALMLAAAGVAKANDSSAALAAGGLVLTRNAAVEMRSEDLYISAKLVRVRYRFLNTSPRDVTLTVAFPMPDITTEGFDDLIAVPTESPTNFLAFRTVVDGQPVKARLEQKAIKNGVDRTALLRAWGVPLAPHLAATNKALDRLPQARKEQLVKLGLAVEDDYDAGKGTEHHLDATWTLKTTYFWTQVFPAGREVAVEHRYQPATGESAGTSWGAAYWPKEKEYAAEKAKYCVDPDFEATAARAVKGDAVSPPYTEQRIGYILTTGGNWAAPIGDFHMTIDKGAAANLVSFCGTGVRKTSPTTFEVRYANFTPTSEVAVLILKPYAKN